MPREREEKPRLPHRTTKPTGRIALRILVDRASIEVFANEGKVVMTSCFLPRPDSAGLELSAQGDSLKIPSMMMHELKSAWPRK